MQKEVQNVAREIGEKNFCLQIEHTAVKKVSQPRSTLEIKLGSLILFVVMKQIFLWEKLGRHRRLFSDRKFGLPIV